MKTVSNLTTALLLLVAISTSAQYTESFSIPNKGILPGTCSSTEASCTSDYLGVDWTINGDFSGMDANDYISTNATGVLEFGGDIDGELCYESPVLDISDVVGAFSFSTDVVWDGHDAADYADVEYKIDGGTWQQIPNQFGGGIHTIDFGTSGNSGSGTIGQLGLFGSSTLSIRVCARTNTSAEGTTVDNIIVPESGVSVLVLPVTWGKLALQHHDRSNTIHWTTYSEINNDFFQVERSADGRIWSAVGQTLAAANSGQSSNAYQYTDDTPLSGTSYYRIKQVDMDGKYAYSSTLTSRREVNSKELVFPNPFVGSLTVKMDDYSRPASHLVTIYDAMGQVIVQQPASENSSEVTIDTETLPVGIYYVDTGTSMLRVVKH